MRGCVLWSYSHTLEEKYDENYTDSVTHGIEELMIHVIRITNGMGVPKENEGRCE